MKAGKTVSSTAAALAALVALPSLPVSSMDKPEWKGGLMMGYSLGQNGQAWPSPLNDPLSNNNRGGFFLSQARVQLLLPLDSTFRAVLVGNVIFSEALDVYLEKEWGSYRLKAGKFRGAGMKSATGTDEFEQTTVQKPRYARHWNFLKNLHNYRDFGIQGEKSAFGGRLEQRLFFHNANGQNVFNDEPSFPAGPATQALGFDYAVDFRVSPFTLIGGHVGAMASREWDEFLGSHEFWEVQYWFKSNAIVDASLYHQMDFTNFHLFTEALIMSNRTVLHADESPTLSWGGSTLARFDLTSRWSPFIGFEFFDPTDGTNPDDALQIYKGGVAYRPSPVRHPSLKATGQYVRSLEEGGRNRVGNDILYAQLQMMF